MKLYIKFFLIAVGIIEYYVRAQSPNCLVTIKKYEQTPEGQKLTNCIKKLKANNYNVCDFSECHNLRFPSFEKDCSSVEDEIFINNAKLDFDKYQNVLDSKCPGINFISSSNIAKSKSNSSEGENKSYFQVSNSQNTKIDSSNQINSYSSKSNANDCENGLQSKINNCHSIYKYDSMKNFEINPICLGNKYNENILKLTVKNDGSIIVNNDENNVLIKDEWNRNKEHNYVIKCNNIMDDLLPDLLNKKNNNSNCRFINDDTKEIIHIFNDNEYTIPKEYTMANTFALGEKIMCDNAGLVLTNEGFKYRYIENGEKNEEDFNGEMNVETKAMVGDLEISSGYFEIPSYNFNLKLESKDGNESYLTLVKYVNKFNNTNKNKYVGITCKNGKLEFYEIYNNERKVYYEYPPISIK